MGKFHQRIYLKLNNNSNPLHVYRARDSFFAETKILCIAKLFAKRSSIHQNQPGRKQKSPATPMSSGRFYAVRTGLEPVTPCVTGMYSNQLN